MRTFVKLEILCLFCVSFARVAIFLCQHIINCTRMDSKAELKKRICVESIKSLEDVSKVNEFVFRVVPVPLLSEMRMSMQGLTLPKVLECLSLWDRYQPTRNGEYGNWCGFHAHLLVLLLSEVYGFKTCKVWGYGLPKVVNHVAVMVTLNKTRYTFDPYFGLYYQTVGNAFIPFDDLIRHLRAKDFANIKIHYAEPTLKKKVMTVAGKTPEQHQWVEMMSLDFYNHIIGLFKQHKSETQLVAKFGHTEHMCLMLLT